MLASKFGSKGGVVFSANGITQYSIDNLREVRSFLEEQRSTWPHGYVLAGTIHRAQKFTVLVSDEAGVTATLSGDAEALKQFDLAHASVSVKSMSSNGYQTQGQGASRSEHTDSTCSDTARNYCRTTRNRHPPMGSSRYPLGIPSSLS